jgi:diketogulonate reductase-like aldo/keto reductase
MNGIEFPEPIQNNNLYLDLTIETINEEGNSQFCKVFMGVSSILKSHLYFLKEIMEFDFHNFPKIGQGCMGIGGRFNRDESNDQLHIRALRYGIDLGLTFLDTAEIYATGHSEELVGKAVKGHRDKVIIGTKFSPEHSKYKDVIEAAENSLRRLDTTYIDIYQIHWPNESVSFEETLSALLKLLDQGKIRKIGVSNFTAKQFILANGILRSVEIFSNQVEYNLFDRHIENNLIPTCKNLGSLIIAYSPLDQGNLAFGSKQNSILEEIAFKYEKSKAQIALSWVVSHENVVAIPKSTNLNHIKANSEIINFQMEKTDLDLISSTFDTKPTMIKPSQIYLSKDNLGDKTYLDLAEAKENSFAYCPSPLELSEQLRDEEDIKPIRVKELGISNGEMEYSLIGGQIRYWAWLFAFGSEKPLPCIIKEAL